MHKKEKHREVGKGMMDGWMMMMVMMMVMKRRGSRVRTDQVHKRTKEDGCLRTMRGGNNDEKKNNNNYNNHDKYVA